MDFRRTTRVYWVVWAVVALIGPLAVAGPASAQTPTASIVGTVLDPQGLPVEGANVTLTNQGTNYAYNTTTSSTGATAPATGRGTRRRCPPGSTSCRSSG